MSMNLQVDPHVERRYKIVRYIGGGAYGVVWKAIDRRTRKLVALKKVFDAFTNDTDAQRTYREAMLLLSLHHVNIVKLLNIVRSLDDVDLYMAFELQESDVHAVIKANILQHSQRQYISYQLVRCVHYLHCKGVIHRDLKPANILINSDCAIKLADFGLARSYSVPALPAGVGGGGGAYGGAAHGVVSGGGLFGGSLGSTPAAMGGQQKNPTPLHSLGDSAAESDLTNADTVAGGGAAVGGRLSSLDEDAAGRTESSMGCDQLLHSSTTVPPSAGAQLGGGAAFNMTVMNSRVIRGADGGGAGMGGGAAGGGKTAAAPPPPAADQHSFAPTYGRDGFPLPPRNAATAGGGPSVGAAAAAAAEAADPYYGRDNYYKTPPPPPAWVAGGGGDEGSAAAAAAADSMPPLTDYIATRWYRAPELLCGTNSYTTAIDMWAVGCVIAELFLGTPLFKGGSTDDQLQLIVCALGAPSTAEVASWRVPAAEAMVGRLRFRTAATANGPYSSLYAQLSSLPRDAAELVKLLLRLDPFERLTSLQALQHPYISVFATPEELFGEEEGEAPSAAAVDLATPVFIELDDGVKHSLQEYRTALYEQAASLKTGGE